MLLQLLVPGAVPTKSTASLGVFPSGTTGTGGTTNVAADVQASGSEALAEEFDERAALVEFGAGVPRDWAEAFARLDIRARGQSAEVWRQIMDDAGRFLDAWGRKAARLGWSAADVFGDDTKHPDGNAQLLGLVPLIRGGEVVSIAADMATIRMSGGGCVVYLRLPRSGQVSKWERADGSTFPSGSRS